MAPTTRGRPCGRSAPLSDSGDLAPARHGYHALANGSPSPPGIASSLKPRLPSPGQRAFRSSHPADDRLTIAAFLDRTFFPNSPAWFVANGAATRLVVGALLALRTAEDQAAVVLLSDRSIPTVTAPHLSRIPSSVPIVVIGGPAALPPGPPPSVRAARLPVPRRQPAATAPPAERRPSVDVHPATLSASPRRWPRPGACGPHNGIRLRRRKPLHRVPRPFATWVKAVAARHASEARPPSSAFTACPAQPSQSPPPSLRLSAPVGARRSPPPRPAGNPEYHGTQAARPSGP